MEDDFDIWDSDEFLGDDTFTGFDEEIETPKMDARRRYEYLMEEKRLRDELEDDIGYW